MQSREERNILSIPISEHAQAIFEKTSLKPFPHQVSKTNKAIPPQQKVKENLYSLPVERISHGAQHASRVAAYTVVLANFRKKHQYEGADKITDLDLRLLQIAALFHDAARESDAKDIWERESAQLCYEYLLTFPEVPKEKAKEFSDLIIKKEKGGLLGKILQSADSIDIIRGKKFFYLDLTSIYRLATTNEQKSELISLTKDIVELIAQQGDIRCDVIVKVNQKEIVRHKKTRDTNLQLKSEYEHATNCYNRVTKDFSNYSTLNSYYNSGNLQLVSEKPKTTITPTATHDDDSKKYYWHLPDLYKFLNEELNSTSDSHLSINKVMENLNKGTHQFWEKKNFFLRLYFYPDNLSSENSTYSYEFKSKEDAERNLLFIKMILWENGISPDLIDSISILKNPEEPYLYKFTLDDNLHAIIDKARKADSLIKSLRWDAASFNKPFIQSITKSNQYTEDERTRKKAHKKYTVYGHGFYDRSHRVKPYQIDPVKLVQVKKETSIHQSTSLVTAEAQIPPFGHSRDRRLKLYGIIFDVTGAPLNRLYKYDRGTISRPYEFDTLEAAQNYYLEKVLSDEPILFSSLDEFKTAIAKDTTQYNEVLARLAFDINTTSAAVFSDTFEARCIAQRFASLLHARLKKQYQENGLTLPKEYEVPIIYYLPNNPKNWAPYTKEQQVKDRLEADLILQNPIKMQDAFDQNNFEFLLIISDPDKVLDLDYNGVPVLNWLVYNGLFEFADFLYERTSKYEQGEKLGDYLMKARVDPSTIPNLSTTLNNAKDHTALHQAIAKKRLDLIPSLEKLNDYTTEIALHYAVRTADCETVELLIKQGIDIEKGNDLSINALHIAVGLNKREIVKLLLDNNANPNAAMQGNWTALQLAAMNGNKEMVELLLKYKADSNFKNSAGKTPYDLACDKNHDDIKDLLAQPQAQLSIKVNAG